MPGDSLNPHPAFLATRAISIAAAPARIWPWLVQMGYGRAGYYGFDILENLGSPRGIRSADRILPEFQHFKVGDAVPISPAARMEFGAIEPGKYLTWVGKTAGSWGVFTWALDPVDPGHTRLVCRIRWSHHWSQPTLLALDLFSEFTDHLAVRKILAGVRDRAEGRRPQALAWQVLEFAVYCFAALILLAALTVVLARQLTWRGWLTGLIAGGAWLVVWYAPGASWIGAVVDLLILAWLLREALLGRAAGRPARAHAASGG
jgi:hypothetical protein